MCHGFSRRGVWKQNNNKWRLPAEKTSRQELKKVREVFEAVSKSGDYAGIIRQHNGKAVVIVQEDLKMKKEKKDVSCSFLERNLFK